MTADADAFRASARDAALAAIGGMSRPALYSVLVDLTDSPSGPVPASLQFGFQELLTGWLFGERLRTCFVVVRLQPRAITVGAVGTYGREQFKALRTIRGLEFPPPPLDLDHLRIGPLQVLDLIRAKPLPAASQGLGDMRLSLCCHEAHLAWRALQEVPRVGFRTLLLDARDAHVLFEKIDDAVASE